MKELTADELIAAALRAREGEPLHRVEWHCPSGCGSAVAAVRRAPQLERGAIQLAHTALRHQCSGSGRRWRVRLDWTDWWVGYYRGPHRHYVCPLPCVAVSWPRR